MSTTIKPREFRVDGVLTNADSMTCVVTRNDTSAVVADTEANPATGVYTFTVTDPAYDLTYTFTITTVYGGVTLQVEAITVVGTISGTAESTLSLTFAQMYANIGAKLYGTRSPTGDNLTECKRIVNEGYSFFVAFHDWSFLHPEATITLGAADADGNFDLPGDFAEPESNFAFGPDSGYPPLQWTTPDVIRAKRAASSSGAIPTLCSLQSVALAAETGQRWELMVWPTPATATTLYYQYLRNPALLSGDNDYPVGGMRYSPAVMACAYMIWEGEQGRTDGAEAVKAMRLLEAAKKTNLRQQPRNVGYNVDNSDNDGRRRIDPMNWQNGLDIS